MSGCGLWVRGSSHQDLELPPHHPLCHTLECRIGWRGELPDSRVCGVVNRKGPSARNWGGEGSWVHPLWDILASSQWKTKQDGPGVTAAGKEARGSGVPWPALELSTFDKRVQAPANFTQTAFDRSLVIFGELSHKFVPSCCRNLLSVGRGRKGREAGRSSQKTGTEAD